jgi:DNA-3-methyladenine glycosylase
MIPAPDRRLRFDPRALGLRKALRSFYRRDTVAVARSLIGAWFARRYRGAWYGGRIVETEAYLGPKDAAAHSWKGRRTPRVEPMYADGGTLYVFFVYGMHYCANIVTRGPGEPQAVLLRAARGPEGAPERLLAGPARLCAALGITGKASGLDLVTGKEFRVFLPRGRRPSIGVSRRIGVDYAGEAAEWPLRFFDRRSPAVSGRRTVVRGRPKVPHRERADPSLRPG